MNVNCPGCQQRHTFHRSLLAQGLRGRCTSCGHVIRLRPTRGHLPPRRRIWVLDNDPGIGRPACQQALASIAQRHDVVVLDESHRTQALADLREGTHAPPDAVVFGDQHVLVEDRLLRVLAHETETACILLSTEHNVELLSRAIAWCRVDQYAALPLSDAELAEHINAAVRQHTPA